METKLTRSATTSESDKFIVRLPDGMRTRIAEAAAANNRTMNAEVVARLQASFEAVPSPDDEFTLRVALEMNESRLEALKTQIYTLQMHVEVLTQRLDVLARDKRPVTDMRGTSDKLTEAQGELASLIQRRAQLLEENQRLHDRHSAATGPLRKRVTKIAELTMQQEREEAERKEAERVAALIALNPTSGEIQRVAEIVSARERERHEKLLGRVKLPRIPEGNGQLMLDEPELHLHPPAPPPVRKPGKRVVATVQKKGGR